MFTPIAFFGGKLEVFVPTDITDLVMWLDASDESTVISSSNEVSGWLDKSGNGNDLSNQSITIDTNTTNNNGKPTYVNNNTISFDGVDDGLWKSYTNWITGNEYSIYIVLKELAIESASSRYLSFTQKTVGNNAAEAGLQYDTSRSKHEYHHRVGTAFNQAQLTQNEILGRQIVKVGVRSNNDVYLNNNFVNIGAVNNFNEPSMSLGFLQRRNTLDAHVEVDINEIIIYNRELSNQEEDNVINYLTKKWSLS
jgi:hypothetical protein